MDSFQRHWQNPFPHASLPQADEPAKATAIGAAHSAPLGIYFSNMATETIDALLRDDPRRPWRGILVGYAAQGPSRPYVLIIGAIAAPAAADSGFHVSSASYDALHSVWQRDYPGTVVVGWFRMNPGYGVGLSADDRFTHHTFFPQRWHTAFIVDPIRASSVFYTAPDGQPQPVDAFYVWNPQNDVALLAMLQQQTEHAAGGRAVKARAATAAAGRKKHRSRAILLLVLLFALILFPAVWRGLPGVEKQLPAAAERLSTLQTEIQQAAAVQFHLQDTSGEREPARTATTMEPLRQDSQKAHSQPSAPEDEDSVVAGTGKTADDPQGVIDSHPITAPLSPAEDGMSRGAPGLSETSTTVPGPGTAYTVAPGDTLWDISRRLSGDPTNYKNIAESNAIPNPDIIFPGMSLQLHDTPLRARQDTDAHTTESE